jgi:ABC-type uncharacterized transport system involved in gliding motility auxiliary subunit
MKTRSAVESLVLCVAAGAALILLNTLSCQSHQKVDLTENGVYSLSPASKRMVKNLPEKLTIKAYFGNVPAEYADRQSYVENLLEEYADAGGKKVDYVRYDVDASDSKDALPKQKELADDGVQKLYLISVKDDENKQVPAYFHVVFQYLDKKEIWSIKQGRDLDLEGMEYEFSSRIRRLSAGKKKIGITQGFGESQAFQAISQPGVDVGQGVRLGLADLYDVTPVDWNKKPSSIRDVDILIVDGPTQHVSDVAKYELDQFVMAGKPVVFLMKGMDFKSSQNQMQAMMQPDADSPYIGQPVDSGLDDLLQHWGFQVEKNVILDGKMSVPGVVPLGNPPLLTNVFFPKVQVLSGDRNGVLDGIPGLIMPYASVVKLVPPLDKDSADYKVQALARTSPYSFAHGDMLVLTRQTVTIDAKGQPKGPFLVGAAAAGPWPSFYADKPKPAGADAPALPDPSNPTAPPPAPLEQKKVAPAGTRLVVVGGQAFADDTTFGMMRMVGDPSYLNGYIALHSMVDWAMQDQELLSVRSKQVLRPLEPVEKGKKLLVKYGNAAGVPLVFVIFGIVYWRLRETRRRKVTL